MKSVWTVERGEYSDYSVLGVFSTKAKAEQICSVLESRDGGRVVERPLDLGVKDLAAGRSVYLVTMLHDGTTEEVRLLDMSGYALEQVGTAYIWQRTKASAYKGTGTPDALQVYCFANSPKHAVKIANERRARMIAEGEWII